MMLLLLHGWSNISLWFKVASNLQLLEGTLGKFMMRMLK
jgi:hypothetical protein